MRSRSVSPVGVQQREINMPNGMVLGGVSLMSTDAKPTLRADGQPLLAGDIWFEPSSGIEWAWTGAEWASTQIFSMHVHLYFGSSGNQATLTQVGVYEWTCQDYLAGTNYGIFVESTSLAIAIEGSTHSASNYFALDFIARHRDNTETVVHTLNTQSFSTINRWYLVKTNVGTAFVEDSSSTTGYSLLALKLSQYGNPPNIYAGGDLLYRWTHP